MRRLAASLCGLVVIQALTLCVCEAGDKGQCAKPLIDVKNRSSMVHLADVSHVKIGLTEYTANGAVMSSTNPDGWITRVLSFKGRRQFIQATFRSMHRVTAVAVRGSSSRQCSEPEFKIAYWPADSNISWAKLWDNDAAYKVINQDFTGNNNPRSTVYNLIKVGSLGDGVHTQAIRIYPTKLGPHNWSCLHFELYGCSTKGSSKLLWPIRKPPRPTQSQQSLHTVTASTPSQAKTSLGVEAHHSLSSSVQTSPLPPGPTANEALPDQNLLTTPENAGKGVSAAESSPTTPIDEIHHTGVKAKAKETKKPFPTIKVAAITGAAACALIVLIVIILIQRRRRRRRSKHSDKKRRRKHASAGLPDPGQMPDSSKQPSQGNFEENYYAVPSKTDPDLTMQSEGMAVDSLATHQYTYATVQKRPKLTQKHSHVGDVPFSKVIVSIQPGEEVDEMEDVVMVEAKKNGSKLGDCHSQDEAAAQRDRIRQTAVARIAERVSSSENSDSEEEHYISAPRHTAKADAAASQ